MYHIAGQPLWFSTHPPVLSIVSDQCLEEVLKYGHCIQSIRMPAVGVNFCYYFLFCCNKLHCSYNVYCMNLPSLCLTVVELVNHCISTSVKKLEQLCSQKEVMKIN